MDTPISPSTGRPYRDSGPKQPDRQVKLQCPKCGGIARMSDTAIRLTGGILCTRDKVRLAPAPSRRAYVRRETVQ